MERTRRGFRQPARRREEVLGMATTVIIPARNEAATIYDIVRVFNEHPETKGNVFVGIDNATGDFTTQEVIMSGGIPIRTCVHGKGQVVYQALLSINLIPNKLSRRIILCDGDYTGLTVEHIDLLLTKYKRGLVIGVPEWPEIEVPDHVTEAWPYVSGLRCLPWVIIPENAHGYLLETQINIIAAKLRQPVRLVPMQGLRSPFQWPLSEKREAARLADLEWGKRNEIL
jgi:hypothetical protein